MMRTRRLLRKLRYTVPITLFIGLGLIATVALLDVLFEIALHAPKFR